MTGKIGKIIYYDGNFGKIITESEEYMFLDKDIEGDFIPHIGEIVFFRGEEVQTINRAYFVTSMSKVIEKNDNPIKNKEKVKNILNIE